MNSRAHKAICIDIFCTVVDNYGDIGVCWRLARQLTREHQLQVRLFVDDRAALAALQPDEESRLQIITWDQDLNYDDCADVVIEAFACTLPDAVITAMCAAKPVWIDLEYLTAEDWTASCHAIPSLHPTTGLKKTLFFPGFDTRTGGLLRENDLISRRNIVQSSVSEQNNWRKSHLLPEIDKNFTDISLFCYKTAPLESFLWGCESSSKPIRIFVPQRGVEPSIRQRGNLTLYNTPFLSQYDYDYLLWTCDLNMVRGEDSFVRAMWAGKPMIWNIYVQDEGAHLIKMQAFLDQIKSFYDPVSWERLALYHNLWNEEAHKSGNLGHDLPQSLSGLMSGAQKWADYLASQSDLSTRLLAFIKTQISL